MRHDLELQIQAWLDGELSNREAARVARLVETDPEARLLAAELRMTKGALAQNEPELKVPETHDFYWSQISRRIAAAEASSERRPASARAIWRRWLFGLSTAMATVTLLVVSLHQFSPGPVNDPDVVTDVASNMQVVTFNDPSANMTVVWLQDREQNNSPESVPGVDFDEHDI